MTDAECVELLQWALPRLGRRWAGYRKVRRQVRRRIRQRIADLDLDGASAYRALLERNPGEWRVLDGLCPITISRFGRDRGTWEALVGDVLPVLGGRPVRCWSIGCASGEEPYTLAIAGAVAGAVLEILATDVDPRVLERARRARYERATLRELPDAWIERGFELVDGTWEVRPRFRELVELRAADVREPPPDRRFDLIGCRNVVCMYFDEPTQRAILAPLLDRLEPGGAFIVGAHEQPPGGLGLEPWHPSRGIYRRT